MPTLIFIVCYLLNINLVQEYNKKEKIQLENVAIVLT